MRYSLSHLLGNTWDLGDDIPTGNLLSFCYVSSTLHLEQLTKCKVVFTPFTRTVAHTSYLPWESLIICFSVPSIPRTQAHSNREVAIGFYHIPPYLLDSAFHLYLPFVLLLLRQLDTGYSNLRGGNLN